MIQLPSMNDVISLTWAKAPSVMKGAARITDLFGKLDEYKTYPDADSRLLKKDWEVVGRDIRMGMSQYEQESTKALPAKS